MAARTGERLAVTRVGVLFAVRVGMHFRRFVTLSAQIDAFEALKLVEVVFVQVMAGRAATLERAVHVFA